MLVNNLLILIQIKFYKTINICLKIKYKGLLFYIIKIASIIINEILIHVIINIQLKCYTKSITILIRNPSIIINLIVKKTILNLTKIYYS